MTSRLNMVPVESSNIEAIGYATETSELMVEFRGNSGVFIYRDVSPGEHAALMEAKSIGSHFHQHIRGKKSGSLLTAKAATADEIAKATKEPTRPSHAPDGDRPPHSYMIEAAVQGLLDAVILARKAGAEVGLRITLPGAEPILLPLDENTAIGYILTTPSP